MNIQTALARVPRTIETCGVIRYSEGQRGSRKQRLSVEHKREIIGLVILVRVLPTTAVPWKDIEKHIFRAYGYTPGQKHMQTVVSEWIKRGMV